MRFLSFQADDNEDLESNDIIENGRVKAEESAVIYEKAPKRLEVAADIVDGKNGGHRRSVRKSSYRSKEKRKKLQRLASMPGMGYLNLKKVLKFYAFKMRKRNSDRYDTDISIMYNR